GAHQAGRTWKGGLDQIRLGARAQIAHRRVNSPAAAGDLLIADAGRAQFLLLSPRLSKDGVRVRINKPGSEHATETVDLERGWILLLGFRRRTDGGDAISDDSDDCTGEHFRVGHLRSATRDRKSTRLNSSH